MRVNANVKVKLNDKLIHELEHGAKLKALEKTIQWVLTEVITSGKVPKDTGALEVSGFVKVINESLGKVIFDTPYARRWYFNYPNPKTGNVAVFSTDKNPNAQDHWMDDFVHGDRRQEAIEMFASFYREELGEILS